jgi:TonB family protein
MSDYSNDIDKYLKGQLTPAQMNALEKKALNDPFLADALQGLDSLDSGQLQSDIEDLRARVARKVRKEVTPWMWTIRIAAGLVILAISTFLIIFISDERQGRNKNLALNKEEKSSQEQQAQPLPPTSDSIQSKPSSPTEVEEEKMPQSAAPAPAAKSSADIRSRAEQVLEQPQADDQQADVEIKEDTDLIDEEISQALNEEPRTANSQGQQSAPSAFEDAAKIETLKKDEIERNVTSDKRKSLSSAGAKEPTVTYNAARKIVRGKVTFSEDGTGLPGVNVLVQGSNEGAVTDAQGNYQIAVEGQPTLQFSFIGFTTTEVKATSDELNVTLDPDISELSEVVVVGISDDVGFQPSTPTVMELAAPEGGRRMFKQYLEQNLQYPQQALENKIEGKVTVQFTIDMTGQLSDFRVVRGLGFGCDDEVIRLIRQGPKWSPTKKNEAPIKDRVRVRMRFSLPKK